MVISLLEYVENFSGQIYFWRNYFFTLLQSNYFDTTVTFFEHFFVRAAAFFEELPFPEQSPLHSGHFSEWLLFQNKTSIEQSLLERSQFLRTGTFWSTDILGGETAQNKDISRRGTFSTQVLSRSINFFRRVTLRKLIFRNSIPEQLLFRVVTFLKDLTVHSSYFFRRATFSQHTFSEEMLFHNCASFLQLHFLFISQ